MCILSRSTGSTSFCFHLIFLRALGFGQFLTSFCNCFDASHHGGFLFANASVYGLLIFPLVLENGTENIVIHHAKHTQESVGLGNKNKTTPAPRFDDEEHFHLYKNSGCGYTGEVIMFLKKISLWDIVLPLLVNQPMSHSQTLGKGLQAHTDVCPDMYSWCQVEYEVK